MAGLPGQTAATAQQTAADLRRMRPARLHVKPYHWYPGIALHQGEARDVDQQVAVLAAAGAQPGSSWRLLASRLRRR
jgi:coproporphyrinogen III oxidase-like Fe-S oxidoreductase